MSPGGPGPDGGKGARCERGPSGALSFSAAGPGGTEPGAPAAGPAGQPMTFMKGIPFTTQASGRYRPPAMELLVFVIILPL